jgi:tetratricopeptide (TPR) repeat protein
VKVWEATTGREILTLTGHAGAVTAVAFSPDGKRLASLSRDHTARVWDGTTGREVFALVGHRGPLTALAYARRGDVIATAGEDRTVRVWDNATGREVLALQGHTGTVTGVAFSHDDKRIASSSEDGSIRLWDAVTGQEVFSLRRQFTSADGVAFSPGGERLLATGRTGGNFVKLWEADEPDTHKRARLADLLRTDARAASNYQAGAYVALRQWEKAVAAYTRVQEAGSPDPALWSRRGDAYGMLGRYARAAEDFARAVKERSDNPSLWYCHALARLGADDLDGFRRECTAMRNRFGKTTSTEARLWLVLTCVVVEEPGADTAELVRWAKAPGVTNDWPRFLGHALYRDGRYAAAAGHLQSWAKNQPLWGDDQFVLAMAQHRSGQASEARATLAGARRWFDDMEGGVARGVYWYWCDRVRTRRLRGEAEALIHDPAAR